MLQNRTFHFAATKELGCSVGQQFRLLDFTAQTTLASSYGLLRISYITAIGAVKWEALNNAWNPSCLFDTKANWANGGGSLAPGTGYLANLFFNENVNPDLGPSNPAFSAPDDFVNAFTNAINYYNHNTTGGPYGQNIVNTYAPQYMPVPSAPILVIAGVALGAAANAGLRCWLTSRQKSLRWAARPQRCRWSTWTNMKPFGTWVKRPGGRKTLLNDAYFLDLDRDGFLEIVNPPEFESYRPDDEEKPEQPEKYAVYKIAGEDGYKPSGLVFEFFREFLAGPAKLQGDGFVASQPGAPYMTIVTGDGRNVLPVSSAEVRLNGELVAGPEKINQNNRLLKVPVIMRAENVVEATFSGPEGSALFIGVAPARSESANRSSRPPLPGTRAAGPDTRMPPVRQLTPSHALRYPVSYESLVRIALFPDGQSFFRAQARATRRKAHRVQPAE
jgi:hypothetical protein